MTLPRLRGVLCLVILTIALSANGFPLGKRLYRALPSVSKNHYHENLPDGSYNRANIALERSKRYAYTGEGRYAAERRLSDGTVECETVVVRGDGVPVKVHYFADSHGYRPRTEVLYRERVRTASSPAVVLAPPSVHAVPPPSIIDAGRGTDDTIISHGGNVAAAEPEINAVIGPGASVHIQPEAVARAGNNHNNYFRSAGSGGDIAVARPKTHAIIGPGASVVIAPRASASSGTDDHDRTVVHNVPVPVPVHNNHIPIEESTGVVVPAAARRSYYYPHPERRVIPVGPLPPPTYTAVRGAGTLIIPPSPSYSYEYSYSSPDQKNPAHGDNRAYVKVRVNQ